MQENDEGTPPPPPPLEPHAYARLELEDRIRVTEKRILVSCAPDREVVKCSHNQGSLACLWLQASGDVEGLLLVKFTFLPAQCICSKHRCKSPAKNVL